MLEMNENSIMTNFQVGDIVAYGPKRNPGLGEVVGFREDGYLIIEDRPIHWPDRKLPFNATNLRPASKKEVRWFQELNRPRSNNNNDI
jgi:hypothetical protein